MLILNQIVQGVVPIEPEIARLSGEPPESRAHVFDLLLFMSDQAGAGADDVPLAMIDAGLSKEPDASLLPMSQTIRPFKRIYPPHVIDQVEPNFRFLVSLVRISDRRHRVCGDDCPHWWHADLGDPQVLKRLGFGPRRWWQFWR